MDLRTGILAIAVTLLAACTEPPAPPPLSAEQQFVDDVAAALGGKAAVEAAVTLMIEAEGRRLNIRTGHDTGSGDDGILDLRVYRRAVDLVNGRSRTEETRTPLFDYFRGRDPFQVVSGIDGDMSPTTSRPTAAPGGLARKSRRSGGRCSTTTPLVLIRAALTNSAMVSNVRSEGDLSLADITTEAGKTFTLAVDPATALPAFIRSTDHHFYLRDVVRRTDFSDYESVGTLRLPSVISRSLDEFHVYRLEATTQSAGTDIGDIGAPTVAVAASPVSGPPPVNVEAEQLADGRSGTWRDNHTTACCWNSTTTSSSSRRRTRRARWVSLR